MKNFKHTVREYIDTNKERLLESLLEVVRQPSISTSGEGVEECCNLIIKRMEEIGIECIKHPVTPFPVITGQSGKDPSKKTVLIYAHYDVQPVGDISLWNSQPFEPEIRDGKIYGRGTADNKGPLMAHLNAVEFLLKEYGELPVNVKFIFEGAEEANSQGLKEFVENNKELLKADMTYFSDGSKNHDDTPIIALGVKGMLYVELILTTMSRDVHSQYAPVLPSAAWQMVELLSKLRKNGIVQIPGFYDDIVPITDKEKEIYKTLPDVTEEIKATYNALPSYPEEEGYYVHLNTTPSFNITGVSSGLTEGGRGTILTSKAVARIDMRLVKNQEGDKIFESLKKYVKDLGYDNVEIKNYGSTPAAKTPVETQYLPVVIDAVEQVFDSAIVYPNRPSTAPDYIWSEILGLPTIQVRWCDFDSDNHAPNEKLSVHNYLKGIEMTATALKKLGGSSL